MRRTINPHLEKELAVPELSVKCIFQDLELGSQLMGDKLIFFITMIQRTLILL